ncbi:RNA polymerase sigma factor [Ornithinimicrobium cerasi]|uniref:RNA polymerase sigma factor n=1 Tax=Ornithinimicrobium cerasi TaxID=2248773 RepID=UPI001F3EB807|nr:DUF6596 domain-containing protein [Ornithinimicrobium cerasi]
MWRREAPHVLAALLRRHGSFDDCEDALQLALLAAAEQWPRDGVPHNPAGWLVRVASRRVVDQVRADTARRGREERAARLDRVDEGVAPSPRAGTEDHDAGRGDDTLDLLVLCTHSSLSPSSQVALMLRAVGGLTTREIADAFFVPEATTTRRITRAKATLREAGARFAHPDARTLAGRLPAVRQAVSLIYTTGHAARSRPGSSDGTLTTTAVHLARELCRRCPGDPENAGLLALLLLTQARRAARFTASGDLVPLDRQDRRLWGRDLIVEGVQVLERALPVGYVGSFQLQASIAAVHADAADARDTDWAQILVLYDMLERVDPTPAVSLGRAVATAEVHGPLAGLAVLEGMPPGSHRLLAARGHMLAGAGLAVEARADLLRAASLTRSIPEQRYLNRLAADL